MAFDGRSGIVYLQIIIKIYWIYYSHYSPVMRPIASIFVPPTTTSGRISLCIVVYSTNIAHPWDSIHFSCRTHTERSRGRYSYIIIIILCSKGIIVIIIMHNKSKLLINPAEFAVCA